MRCRHVDNSHADGRCDSIQFGTQRRLGDSDGSPEGAAMDVGDRHRPTVPVRGARRQSMGRWTTPNLWTNIRLRLHELADGGQASRNLPDNRDDPRQGGRRRGSS